MIKITIELWPMSNVSSRRTLHEIAIWNTGGTDTTGEYGYVVSKVGGFKLPDALLPRALANHAAGMKHVLRRGWVIGFPRKRLYAADLLFRVLRSAVGERNQ